MSGPLEDDAVAWNVGRYTLYGEIASGGMATVHIGRMAGAAGFAKLVAIKRMHPQFAKDEDFLAMFLDEARLATRIRHPNVVPMLDVIADGGEVLIVMEYVHGDALSRIQRVLRTSKERIPLRIAVAIGAAALHGLHAAHEAKSERGEPLDIVHRDVSPQNILVGIDGVPRVIDFGIAKAADQVHMTRQGELKGKLVYMAPEQLLGEPVTRQSDVFSMSIVVWEMLTGERLFENTDSSSALGGARARHATIEPPSSIVPDLPKAVDDIVMRGLSLAHEARWESAREMAVALEDAVAPATPAQIGAWVEKVAATALTERQARIDEIELRGADMAQSSHQLAKDLKELGSDRVFTADREGSARSQAKRIVPSATPARRPAREQPNGTRVDTGPGSKDPLETATPSAPFPVSKLPKPRPSRPTPIPISSDPYAVPPAAPLDMASGPLVLAAPAIPTEHAKPARTTVVKMGGKSHSGVFIALFVIVACVGFLFWLPGLVKKDYTAAAAARGVTLVVDDVDLLSHFGSVDLVGLTLSTSEVPGAVVHAKTVHVGLDSHLDPTVITAANVDVTLDSSFSALQTALTRFGNTHSQLLPATVTQVSMESGHVLWTQPLGTGTQAESRGVGLSVTRTGDRSLGEDFVLSPALVTLSTPLGAMGPWVVDAQKSAAGITARLSLDPRAKQNAGIDVSVKDGKSSVDLRALNASPAELSIKPEALNAKDGETVRVDAALHSTIENGIFAATLDVHAEGWRPSGGGPSATLSIVGAAKGDANKPIDITDGHISLGGAATPLTGSVTVADDGIVLKGAGTASLKCDGFVRSTPLSLFADTRDIGKWSLALGAGCSKAK